MNSEWKVCTFEQSQRFLELGVVLETERYWHPVPTKQGAKIQLWNINTIPILTDTFIPAPDGAELSIVLPYYDLLTVQKEAPGYYCWYYYDKYSGVRKSGNGVTEAQTLCDALIWLIEKGYINPEDLR